MKTNLFDAAHACIAVCDPDEKVALTRRTARVFVEGKVGIESDRPPQPIGEPGRPERPRLVPPGKVPQRRLSTPEGRAALVHALTHIEFNAVNLAWDAVYRFRGMPLDYYKNWVCVAEEEACHFELLRDRLAELGFRYGDFDAHGGLWEMARKTAHDVMVRMALLPRVLEARGLDVTPGLMERLSRAGDERTASILRAILRDEIGHVAAGTRWFRYECERRGMEPDSVFQDLIRRYMKGRIKGPFHVQARSQAGFSRTELENLKMMDGSRT